MNCKDEPTIATTESRGFVIDGNGKLQPFKAIKKTIRGYNAPQQVNLQEGRHTIVSVMVWVEDGSVKNIVEVYVYYIEVNANGQTKKDYSDTQSGRPSWDLFKQVIKVLFKGKSGVEIHNYTAQCSPPLMRYLKWPEVEQLPSSNHYGPTSAPSETDSSDLLLELVEEHSVDSPSLYELFPGEVPSGQKALEEREKKEALKKRIKQRDLESHLRYCALLLREKNAGYPITKQEDEVVLDALHHAESNPEIRSSLYPENKLYP